MSASSAELPGFSALAEAHGDDDAPDLAVDLARCVRSVAGFDEELVKTIGDAVMVRKGAAA